MGFSQYLCIPLASSQGDLDRRHTLSWDARCSGIFIGFGTGTLWHLGVNRRTAALPAWPALAVNWLLFLPLFIDVVTIQSGIRQPSNDRRYRTGLFFGTALNIVLCPAFIMAVCKAAGEVSGLSPRGFVALTASALGAFFLKGWDSWAAYAFLEALAVSGFLVCSPCSSTEPSKR